MAGVFADNHDVAVTTNDLALVADGLNAGVDLHCFLLLSPASYPTVVGTFLTLWLLVSVDDTSTRKVIGAELYDDAVLGEDTDVVLAHFARDVSENDVSVCQLNAKHRVGQGLDNRSLDLDNAVFVSHISIQ